MVVLVLLPGLREGAAEAKTSGGPDCARARRIKAMNVIGDGDEKRRDLSPQEV
jgi:hypothetical protein